MNPQKAVEAAERASEQRSSGQFTAADYDKALLTPSQIFAAPGDVVSTSSLTAQQKLKVLKRWEADSNDLEVASGESMTGGERSRLGEVRAAIHDLCEREKLEECGTVQK